MSELPLPAEPLHSRPLEKRRKEDLFGEKKFKAKFDTESAADTFSIEGYLSYVWGTRGLLGTEEEEYGLVLFQPSTSMCVVYFLVSCWARSGRSLKECVAVPRASGLGCNSWVL